MEENIKLAQNYYDRQRHQIYELEQAIEKERKLVLEEKNAVSKLEQLLTEKKNKFRVNMKMGGSKWNKNIRKKKECSKNVLCCVVVLNSWKLCRTT